jgi:hypothetical protein
MSFTGDINAALLAAPKAIKGLSANSVTADEPLRRSWVISRALFGWGSDEYVWLERIRNCAVDEAAIEKLRFREGAHLRIVSGPAPV